MTELERQLMKALKEWGEQYEQDQKRLAGQVSSLSERVSRLAAQYERDQKQQAELVEDLLRQVGSLAEDYNKVAEALIAIHEHLSRS